MSSFILVNFENFISILNIDPKKRMQGSFFEVALVGLLGASTIFGAKLLGWL